MSILTIFKFKSSKSKAKKLSISAPVAVAAVPPTTEVVPSSSRSSTEEATEPSQAVTDDSALTAPVQVIKGNQKYLGPVANNNSITANSNNNNVGNVNSTITGDNVTIDKGIDEIFFGPAKMLFTPEGASTPTRIRNSVTIERNGMVETIPLDLPSGGLGIEGNVVTSNPDLPTMIEQAMRAHGTAEPIIRHTVNGLKLALQMKALQPYVAVTA